LLQSIWGSGWLRRVSTVALVLASIGVALLPAWKIQLIPRSVRIKYRYMYSHPGFRTEYEEWQHQKKGVANSKEIGLALKSYARPGSSLVAGGIGALGYYSDLFVYDRFGLVSPEVVEWAKRQGRRGPLGSPGHDVKVSRDQYFTVWERQFLKEYPTYLFFDVMESRNMRSRVLEQAEEWRALGSLWRRYAPDFIVLDGKSISETNRLLFVFRAIEYEANGGLDQSKRTKAVWQDFYARAGKLAYRRSSPKRPIAPSEVRRNGRRWKVSQSPKILNR
jgi:hypothetical protein